MKVKYEFSVSTNKIGSEITETVEYDLDDDLTDEQIEEIIQEEYVDWRNEKLDGSWRRVYPIVPF